MKKHAEQSSEKVQVIKSKLKRRALEAQKQIEKALELGKVDEAK